MKASFNGLTPAVMRDNFGDPSLEFWAAKEAASTQAQRSKMGIFMYLFTWAMLMATTDIFSISPKVMGAVGVLFAGIGMLRLQLIRNFDIWYSRNPQRWQWAYNAGIIVSALIWGLFCTITIASFGLDEASMVALLATAGLAAGGITYLAPMLWVARAYIILLLLPPSVAALLHGFSFALALTMWLYMGFLILVALRFHQEYWQALMNRQLLVQHSAELELARNQALAAVRTKDEFLTAMSHELRTPLNAILGFSELLTLGRAGALSAAQLSYVHEIEHGGQHLLELINDILDLAKIDAGRIELELHQVDVGDLCESSLRLVRPQAQARGISLQYLPPHPPIVLLADQLRLRQILVNLLTNAVKFTPQGGEVGLDVFTNKTGEIRLEVWDTGIGIDAKDQAKLFQPFVQVDASLARKFEGTGLGLALVKNLAELHGGSVGMESSPGKGSRFWVCLPQAESSK